METLKPIDCGDASLALRPYEKLSIRDVYPEHPIGRVYGVAIVRTPEFPGQRESTHRDEKPSAIVACTYFKHLDGWGFIHLEENTKRTIGNLMFDECHCAPGRWYWMELTESAPASVGT